jgi:hypothetical protein
MADHASAAPGATPNDLADALIRMFGRNAAEQARENALSNGQAGDSASKQMWLGVAAIVTAKLGRGTAHESGPR